MLCYARRMLHRRRALGTLLSLTTALLLLTASLPGCSWLQTKGPEAVDVLADVTRCALANLYLPTEEILKHCAAPEDLITKLIPLIGEARRSVDREAMIHAAAIRAETCDGGIK